MNNAIQNPLSAPVFEIPLPPDKFGQDGGKFYRAYDALAQEIDDDMVAGLKEQLDGILIFAGLFAGVNSAFLALTLPMLSPDSTDDTNALLAQNNLILMQLAMGRNDSLPRNTDLPSTSFSPSGSIFTVNVLFSLSLTFALISSFLAVIGRQWLVYYRKRSGGGPDRQRWEQLKRFLGAERWRLELILDDILPSLLQIGLIIFSVSLIIYLDSLSPAVAKIVGIPIYVGFAFLIGGALCIVWDKFCPFQSPLSHSLISIVRSVPLAVLLVKHGLVLSFGLLKDYSVRFLGHPRHAVAEILGIIQQTQLKNLFRTPLMHSIAWLKHVREEESPELLPIIALRRAICTSDDPATLLHAAANIPAIYEPDLLQSLWDDQSFLDRLMELYKDSWDSDQLTSRWADLTLSPIRLYSVGVIHLLLFLDHDLPTFTDFITQTMDLEWLYFNRVWVPAEIPSGSPMALIRVSLVLSAISIMSASRGMQDKQRFCVYLVMCSDALRTPDWRLLSLIYWTVSQLATVLESPPDDWRVLANPFRGDLDTTLDSIDQALSRIAEHGAIYSFDSDRILTNLLRCTFQVFTSECQGPFLEIHHVMRVVRAVEMALRSAFWSAEAVEMGRKVRMHGLASVLNSPIHIVPLISANNIIITQEALDALTCLFVSLRATPRRQFSYQEDMDVVAMFTTPMDMILSGRMAFEANGTYRFGSIPEILQLASTSLQRAWDGFRFDIENCGGALQRDLMRFRDTEHLCGVLGLLLHDQDGQAAPEICEGLSLLQHRGQDACGIVTCGAKGKLNQCKANGMVRDVFDPKSLSSLVGAMGIGHVRYPTAGSSAHSEAQPFYVNSPYGIVFAHNGNLINTSDLKYFLDHEAHRHINTDSDSELLLNIFADNLQKTGKFRINEEDIFTAIGDLMRHCRGAYACVAMIAGFGIIAFRDPNGIRPVGMARRRTPDGAYDYIFSSESVVADAGGFGEWEDVRAGEAIIITRLSVTRRHLVPDRTFAPDIFEYVYFARPDSVLDGVSVYRSRMAMGENLAAEVERVLKEKGIKVDVVIPVPDTSRVSALELAQRLGLPYREGFVKNRYVGRTFIMPGQQMRKKNVRRKLNAMALEFANKVVLLVDDSIVRGTTSKEIIQMAKDVGAKKVIFASCAPPIRYSNVYGIDMPSRNELVAFERSEDEIAKALGADVVIYQTLPDLINSVTQFNPALTRFDCSVFDGVYVTGDVQEGYLAHLERLRSDNAKIKTMSMGMSLPPDEAAPLANSPARGRIANGTNGVLGEPYEVHEEPVGCSGPMNGADDTVGLYNSWSAAASEKSRERSQGRSDIGGLSSFTS